MSLSRSHRQTLSLFPNFHLYSLFLLDSVISLTKIPGLFVRHIFLFHLLIVKMVRFMRISICSSLADIGWYLFLTSMHTRSYKNRRKRKRKENSSKFLVIRKQALSWANFNKRNVFAHQSKFTFRLSSSWIPKLFQWTSSFFVWIACNCYDNVTAASKALVGIVHSCPFSYVGDKSKASDLQTVSLRQSYLLAYFHVSTIVTIVCAYRTSNTYRKICRGLEYVLISWFKILVSRSRRQDSLTLFSFFFSSFSLLCFTFFFLIIMSFEQKDDSAEPSRVCDVRYSEVTRETLFTPVTRITEAL